VSANVEFEFRLVGTGWAEGRIAIGHEFATPTASYLSDALGDLIRAVRALCAGAHEERASWDEEPGEYRWIFERGGSTVRLRLLALPEWRAIVDAPDADGEVLLDAECQVSDLGSAIASGARRLLNEVGADGYREKWVEDPFPLDELTALEQSLNSTSS
jgi:hypothetical protein